ncbi:ABC transporter ATP-binding protein [Ktedonosporobacter rubrisoli]|uniref:ABC transporter ATP-binding protein n=1 Tax=Ktedonosporobacter rubrisoli TaxID=2509675 RepID=UPI001A919FAA|nr:ABC transporter ATP-binding protein [Ktedonosporobacter rubrisoli]
MSSTIYAGEPKFGKVQAVKGISFAVYPGELLALLAPNGSGKTTTLSLMLGGRKPDRGEIRLFGLDPRQPQARLRVGVTPQETNFPWTLRVEEIIELVNGHFPQPLKVEELATRFDLSEIMHRQTGGLSGGQRRKLALALAFAGGPDIVFLDEPTVGLDVEVRMRLWQEVRKYLQGRGTVVLTTHYLEEAEALATRVLIMNKGQVIDEGSVEEIKGRVGLKHVRFRASHLPELADLAVLERAEDRYTGYVQDADALVRSLVQHNVDFHGLEILPATLEEAFLQMTGETK